MTHKTAIVGMGAVTALGHGVASLWSNLLESRCGLALTRFMTLTDLPPILVGEVDGFATNDMRVFELAHTAATEAIAAAHWDCATLQHPRTALVVSTAKGYVRRLQLALETNTSLANADLLSPLAQQLSHACHIGGEVLTVTSACASGSVAIGHAHRLIKYGRADRVLVVGADALTEFIVRGFFSLKALAKNVARPFDANRDGLSLGEGAGAIAMEKLAGSRSDDDRNFVRVLATGTSNDAHHITSPDPTGNGLSRAIGAALQEANLAPTDIGGISAHGTGTKQNDAMEARALMTLGDITDVPIHGIKGAIGHTLGAAGVLEAIVAAQALREQIWPPTVGLEHPDPDCTQLCIVRNVARPHHSRIVLSTSAGFSGINAAIVLCRP